ncbi:molybdopterin oxidoreductase family protein [Leptolyngbya sp. NIES-2104]|uniref:molybdopterin oxidoreductase family protein n=1 Tax=Leptolyngbya sp. NIES-2104 TaxID=1552121 RepID=UPI0006EC6FF0|nr:nitrate reductase [Leptolyngbya sp. NIES-2104]GAP99407.1 assimilatory nitrate reductase large subunit [Leptolyngbya sp. NIES-2104]
MTEITKTLCPYCGVGCGLEVSPPAQQGQATHRDAEGTPIWKVKGDRTHPSSQGMVCVKGATITEALDKQRLLYPMMRNSLDAPFERVTWDQALDRIVQEIQQTRAYYGSEALCLYGSGQFMTEDYYVMHKLMRGFLGSNNIDSNSRLCMSSAVTAYAQSLGSDGPPCCYDDLELTDCAFLVGTNAAECHPIIFNRLRKYHRQHRHVKMIVVDPRRTPTAEAADLHLAIRPGTDIDLLNGIAYLLSEWQKVDYAFIDDCVANFPAYAEVIKHYPPDVVARRCNISIEDLETAARYWASSKRVLSLWTMGVNQSSEGTAKARSLINLHLLTGQIGKLGAGPFSLTGQPNAMGGREVGGLAGLLPGYRWVKNPHDRAFVEQFWQLPPGQISPQPGRTAWEMIRGLESGDVRFLWIAATNPAVSLPDLPRTKAALQASPFTVCQDAYYPTETANYAHVLLPAAQWGEKTGTMTNSERVVTLLPAFRNPPGQAKADWEIFAEVGRRLDFSAAFQFRDAAQVFAEFVQMTRDRVCDMSGISHELLKKGAVQWPYSIDRPDASTAKRLYTDHRFPTTDGRARFGAYHSRGVAEPPDDDYPFVLTTGRLYGHWHTQTRTGRIHKLRQMHPRPVLEIHPHDAARLGLRTDDWIEVRSRRGKAKFPITVTSAIVPGTVFVPMHWGALWATEAEANSLTHPISCPESSQPELKACAVQLIPVGAEPMSSVPAAEFVMAEIQI